MTTDVSIFQHDNNNINYFQTCSYGIIFTKNADKIYNQCQRFPDYMLSINSNRHQELGKY